MRYGLSLRACGAQLQRLAQNLPEEQGRQHNDEISQSLEGMGFQAQYRRVPSSEHTQTHLSPEANSKSAAEEIVNTVSSIGWQQFLHWKIAPLLPVCLKKESTVKRTQLTLRF